MQRFLPAILACCALCLTLLTPDRARAHRVNIFAFVDGGDIVVECGFSRGKRVQGGDMEVLDAVTGQTLLRGVTSHEGVFRFPVPAAARQTGHALRIRVNAGEGHQNECTVSAGELADASPQASALTAKDAEAAAARTRPAASASSGASGPTASAVPTAALTPADVERIVNAALDARLAPIKRMLAERTEAGPGLREIIGGIGWIFGIVGVAAYFRRRPH